MIFAIIDDNSLIKSKLSFKLNRDEIFLSLITKLNIWSREDDRWEEVSILIISQYT